jgi:hypothetical protein
MNTIANNTWMRDGDECTYALVRVASDGLLVRKTAYTCYTETSVAAHPVRARALSSDCVLVPPLFACWKSSGRWRRAREELASGEVWGETRGTGKCDG